MKNSRLRLVLAFEALVCFVFSILGARFQDSFTSIMAFPFEQIGTGLRDLSLSSVVGNVVSIVLYILFCMLPTAYLLIRMRKNKIYAEDGLLVLLSVILFAVIYMMINPADIARHFGSSELVYVNKALLGATVYSMCVGYLILRVLRVFSESRTVFLLRYLKILLGAVSVVLVYGIFGSELMGLQDSFDLLTSGNTNAGKELIISYGFLVLQYLVDVLPFVFNIIIIFTGFDLINALENDMYGEEVILAGQKTGRICRVAVVVIILSQVVVNLSQLVLGSIVRASHYTLNIPLLSVVFMLVAMLLAKYFEQTRVLKRENDSII